MENARMESLLSEQESAQVEITFSGRALTLQRGSLVIYLQQTNKPKSLLLRTKPSACMGGQLDIAQPLIMEYYFEVRQKLIIEVYSNDTARPNLIGCLQATVGEIFNGRAKGISKDITQLGKTQGKMMLRCEAVGRGSSHFSQFDLSTRNLDVGSAFFCFGEGKALWRLYRKRNNEEILIYESEVRQGSQNRYTRLRINQRRLCSQDPTQPVVLRFFNEHGSSPIGQTQFTLAQLRSGQLSLNVLRKGSERGRVAITNYKESVKYDFRDFIQSGLELSMLVCIDFTASNGMTTAPTSLHYCSNERRSVYEEALLETCNIVLDYDKDKLVPLFGFGAKVHLPTFETGQQTHHCFPLNGSIENPNVFMVDGILQAYRQVLPRINLSGPTFFAPLIQQAMNVCIAKKNTKEYMILMIMTDGIIHDKDKVIDLLVACARLPISIIIVGLGNNEDGWAAMHELDDDNCQMIDSKGKKSERDLVQFVEFAKHSNNGVQLAREVLEELPRQVVEYHQLIGRGPETYKDNLQSSINYQQINPYT